MLASSIQDGVLIDVIWHGTCACCLLWAYGLLRIPDRVANRCHHPIPCLDIYLAIPDVTTGLSRVKTGLTARPCMLSL